MSLGKKAQIGVTGLAVMGRNLARNIARHGYVTAVHNRTYARTQSLIEDHGDEGEFVPSTTMEEFVESLERPRTIISMVQAGVATDAVINELVPLLVGENNGAGNQIPGRAEQTAGGSSLGTRRGFPETPPRFHGNHRVTPPITAIRLPWLLRFQTVLYREPHS